jgi:hypothetical protein
MAMGMQMISMELTKDVPVPPDKRRYPYRVMDVGDSFFVAEGRLQVVCNNNYRVGKKLGRKFVARREESGVRVWRVS